MLVKERNGELGKMSHCQWKPLGQELSFERNSGVVESRPILDFWELIKKVIEKSRVFLSEYWTKYGDKNCNGCG